MTGSPESEVELGQVSTISPGASSNAPGEIVRTPFGRRIIGGGLRSATLQGLLGFVLLGIVWEFLGRTNFSPLIISPLTEVFTTAYDQWQLGILQRDITTSLQEFAYGFALAAVVGIAVGLVMAISTTVRNLVDPLLSAAFATPVIGLAPMFIIAFGIGMTSKVVIVFLLAVLPITISTNAGIRATDQAFVDTARAFCARRHQIFTKILLPASLSFIVAGLRLGVGRGLIGIVAGEFFGSSAGLGYRMVIGSQAYDPALVWMAILILAGTGVLSTVALQQLERRLAPWRRLEIK